MLNQCAKSCSTTGKCAPMQAIITRALGSFNHRETKMFLLTDELLRVSKLEFIGKCYGGFIIPLIFCTPKIFGTKFLTYALIDNTNFKE